MSRLAYPLAFLASIALGSVASAGEIELSLPVDCEPGRTCMVQNLVDADAGPDRRDAFCGRATYDGHKGTDFRVADLAAMREGADVLAAAPGRVKAVRDGEPDALQSAAAVRGRECGNGLVIDHGNGWETQYCHLARDSVRVAQGARVRRGQLLGRIGLSGRTQFPHVHLSLRKDGRTIDPASGAPIEPGPVARCASNGGPGTLWDEKAARAVRDDRRRIVAAGWAGGKVSGEAVMRSQVRVPASSGPLVFYAQFMNVRRGDVVALEIVDGRGRVVASKPRPILKDQATYTAFVGKSRMAPGRYEGRAVLSRDGVPLSDARRAWTR